jgi:predicted AlkP superfamily phosphohydrolase/phosphomutase
MADGVPSKSTRRTFLKRTAAVGAGTAAAGLFLGGVNRVSRAAGKKVVVIGIDGMDPRLSEAMMAEGQLPNLAKMRAAGGFSPLGTSTPPQSPVAWANFINGAGPGSHGIFDFIHRHPEDIHHPFFSAAETVPGEGGWEVQDFKIPLDFWPYNDKPPRTELRRQGTPFWDYLDEAGVPSTFYDLPSNYPASPSKCGHHRCLCGMGTPDVRGTYGTYHYFSEDGPEKEEDGREQGGMRFRVAFENDTARVKLVGPDHSLLKNPEALKLELAIHRDRQANAVVLQLPGQRILLKPGQWSRWVRLEFEMRMPRLLPDKTVSGVCRFYLQEVAPNFRLYVSPINVDPRDPVVPISEPGSFVTDISKKLGPFYTTGFQEDHFARRNGVFDDEEYLKQANYVLEERLKLLEHAIQNYDDGLLYFYFSSSDLQSHMFWWEGDEAHPSRPPEQARKFHGHIKSLYRKLDTVIGDLHDRYGGVATIIVMSDHGFANFGWQFNLNAWLRDWNYLQPNECTSVMRDVDWSRTKAYGLGINGLYLNLKGREPNGIVEPGEVDELVEEITNRLVLATKFNDQPVIRGVYRSSQIYSGPATALAPDLIVGYHRGFRASWASVLGDMVAPDPVTGEVVQEQTFSKNTAAWSADHCADALEVPGVFWCSKPIKGQNPSLVDLAPSILAMYGLPTPPTMTGRDVLGE